jgi:hypothetical protein
VAQFSEFAEPAPEQLLANLLEPLLEDFGYWFDKAADLLQNHRLEFISEQEQAHILSRVRTAQQEVQTAKTLFALSGKRVGIDAQAMLPWHNLLMECQALGMRYRQSQRQS